MTPDPLFSTNATATQVRGIACGPKGCAPFTVVRRHIPPGVRHRANVMEAAAAKPKPPLEPMPVIPMDQLAEVVSILRRRAPHCFLCRMIVAGMVGPDFKPYVTPAGDELFPLRGQIGHALDELEMARHPDWVAAQRAVGTY